MPEVIKPERIRGQDTPKKAFAEETSLLERDTVISIVKSEEGKIENKNSNEETPGGQPNEKPTHFF